MTPIADTSTMDWYQAAKHAVAGLIAQEAGEKLAVRHHNQATKVLWPLLSDETRSRLVLR